VPARVDQVQRGHARDLHIDDMTQGFTASHKFCEQLVPTILALMKEAAK
jgi:hypothetical protein